MDPLVSIIIPVYNGENYMRDAINSALYQTYSNIEIIVVNDGSNDNGKTRKVALSYGKKIRYFEKKNGGVSTALNMGIKNMRGEYFSWLSHDDIYLPNKVQEEIDALRASGDMSKVVYSNWYSLKMPEGKKTEFTGILPYRQEFLETGAFASLFSFISGCTLLIPKKYFDDYGGFDEKYYAVQDYKKWFEMFRGKRLIYLRKALILSRVHAEQTTKTYDKIKDEEEFLREYMVSNLEAGDIVGSGLTDLYHAYSAFFSRYINHLHMINAIEFVYQKLKELPESPDTDERIKKFKEFLFDPNYKTYYLDNDYKDLLKIELLLRGISPQNLNFVSIEEMNKIAQNNRNGKIRFFEFVLLLQWIIDTPIKKDLLNENLLNQIVNVQ